MKEGFSVSMAGDLDTAAPGQPQLFELKMLGIGMMTAANYHGVAIRN